MIRPLASDQGNGTVSTLTSIDAGQLSVTAMWALEKNPNKAAHPNSSLECWAELET
jgi:hypothetical protein